MARGVARTRVSVQVAAASQRPGCVRSCAARGMSVCKSLGRYSLVPPGVTVSRCDGQSGVVRRSVIYSLEAYMAAGRMTSWRRRAASKCTRDVQCHWEVVLSAVPHTGGRRTRAKPRKARQEWEWRARR